MYANFGQDDPKIFHNLTWGAKVSVMLISDTSRSWYEYSNLLFLSVMAVWKNVLENKQDNKESSKDIFFLLFLSKAKMSTIRRICSSTNT